MSSTAKNLSLNNNHHLLTGEELSVYEIKKLIKSAFALKHSRYQNIFKTSLAGKSLAMLFDKPSLRTRFSFTIAMRELGGDVIESSAQSRKEELPQDQARVLNGYCHAVMVRTHEDSYLQQMASASEIPIINGLSNLFHPCQILADLMTLQEHYGDLDNLSLAYVGDGNNILNTLLLIAPQLGIHVHYACPPNRGPNELVLAKSLKRLPLGTGKIRAFEKPLAAVQGANAVYTDVWTSMGFEAQCEEHLFAGYQVNESLMQAAAPGALFMHCLPMLRGKEVSHNLPDSACSVIFKQSENRLHIQKSLLLYLLRGSNE